MTHAIPRPKPKVRVRAQSIRMPSGIHNTPAQMRYLRGDSSRILQNKKVSLREGSVDVNEAALRASALAWDFIQNSGWVAGACNQIITDVVGDEVKINYNPDLSKLGYSDNERDVWAKEQENAFKEWMSDKGEVDLAGEKSLHEMSDADVRFFLAGGECFVVASYLTKEQREELGCETSTKLTIVPAHRLKNETNSLTGLENGIFKNEVNRAVGYRFKVKGRLGGRFDKDDDIPAYDGEGLPVVLHVMDRGENPSSNRGISVMAPVFNTLAKRDKLADYTLTTALAQAMFAATIKSPEASEEVFDAIMQAEMMDDGKYTIGNQLKDLWAERLELIQNTALNLDNGIQINHLAPGEEFQFHSSATPNPNYVPFDKSLHLETARCLSVTGSSYTGDYSNATYASSRMEISTIWPTTVRRRGRVYAPLVQFAFKLWLEERIARGLTEVKGGYEAYKANRKAFWKMRVLGPGRPVADDTKATQAAKNRMENGTSSMQDECALEGKDYDEVRARRKIEHQHCLDDGVPSPFVKVQGGGPNGGAAEGQRDPKKPKENDDDGSS